MIQTIHSFLPFDCVTKLITLAKNSHKIPRKFIISVPPKLKEGKFKALHKRQNQSVNEWKTTNLASSAKILYTTHADMAFLSKLVMHNKQAHSNLFFLAALRDSQLHLRRSKLDSALVMHSFMCLLVSSTYVCALERGKIWEFSQWQSLVVA